MAQKELKTPQGEVIKEGQAIAKAGEQLKELPKTQRQHTVKDEAVLLIQTGKLDKAHELITSQIKGLERNNPDYQAWISIYEMLNNELRETWYANTNTSQIDKLIHGHDFIEAAIEGSKPKASIKDIIGYLNNKITKGFAFPKGASKLALIAEDEAYSLIDFKPRQGYVAMLGFYELTKGDILQKKFDLREGNLYIIGHNALDKGVSIGDRVAVNVVPNPYLIDAGLPNDINRIDATRFDTMANSNLKEVSPSAAASIIKDLKSPVGKKGVPKKINYQGLPKIEVTVIILMSIATVMANKSLTLRDIHGVPDEQVKA